MLLMAQKKLPHPEAPGAARPRRTHDVRPSYRIPRDLLDRVVEYFRPQRVILFGSTARGEATCDSDIDLLVIVDDDTPPEKLTWRTGHECVRSVQPPADVFPCRESVFRARRRIAGTLAYEATQDGLVVYDRALNAPPEVVAEVNQQLDGYEASLVAGLDKYLGIGDQQRLAAEAGERARVAECWLRTAENQIRAVRVCVDAKLLAPAAYHCEQAAEKITKGLLIAAGAAFRVRYGLRQLANLALARYPELKASLERVRPLAPWAIAYRYPEARDLSQTVPEAAEIVQMLGIVEALAARLSSLLSDADEKKGTPEPFVTVANRDMTGN